MFYSIIYSCTIDNLQVTWSYSQLRARHITCGMICFRFQSPNKATSIVHTSVIILGELTLQHFGASSEILVPVQAVPLDFRGVCLYMVWSPTHTWQLLSWNQHMGVASLCHVVINLWSALSTLWQAICWDHHHCAVWCNFLLYLQAVCCVIIIVELCVILCQHLEWILQSAC